MSKRREPGEDDAYVDSDNEIVPAKPPKRPRRNVPPPPVPDADVEMDGAVGSSWKSVQLAVRDEEENEEEDDDESGAARASGRRSQPGEEDDCDLDGDEESEDEDATAAGRKLSKTLGFANAGILQSVRLDRFMSHECFKYTLGPNVNIINGANGSGKSAIVAALQIGLGAMASATERASRIDDHIMHGKDSAIITINILNHKPAVAEDGTCAEADETFKHDMYGDIITIERRLVRGKASSWAVKTKKGRHAQLPKDHTPAKEVRAIVDHFGFMVNNPVAILTQTKSKAFLAKGKPAEHYKLYKEATLLGPVEQELAKTQNVAEEVRNLVKSKMALVPETEEALEKLEIANREAQEMKNIDTRISETQALFAWTVVAEHEAELTYFEDQTKTRFKPAAEKAAAALQAGQDKVDNAAIAMQSLDEAVAESTEKVRLAAASHRSSAKGLHQRKLELQKRKESAKILEDEIADQRESIVSTRVAMDKAREKHFAGQEQKSELVRLITDAENRVAGHIESRAMVQLEETKASEAVMAVDEELPRAKADFENARQQFQNKRSEHMRVSAAAKNKDGLARFGHQFPDIAARIRQHINRFHQPPIGPLGQHIKVRDQKWAFAVETAIHRSTLQTFLVHDSHDSSLLQSLLPRGPRPPILITNLNRERYTIREHDMPDVRPLGHCTMLDILEIDHNAVFNALVDQSQIERSVLANQPPGEDITQLAWSGMRNLGTVWNIIAERAYSRGGSGAFRKAPRGSRASQYLTEDMRPYLESLSHEVRALEQSVKAHSDTVKNYEGQRREAARAMDGARRELRKLQAAIDQCMRDKQAIEDQLSMADNAFDATPFENEIDGYEHGIRENETRRQAELRHAEELAHNLTELQEQSREFAEQAKHANADLSRATESLNTARDEVGKVRSRLRQLKSNSQKAKDQLHSAYTEIEHKTAEVVGARESARKFVEEMPADVNHEQQSSKKLKNAIELLKKRLEAEQEHRGGRTADQIEMEFYQAKEHHDKNTQLLKLIRFYSKALDEGVRTRKKHLMDLNKTFKKSVRFNFRQFLSIRGHSGNIAFKTGENGAHELHISTKMASHKKGDGELYVTKDLRSLSGGERSYTTLSFMLALAEVCQNPVRVMDEIDVFQDEANRHASFKTMVEFCTSYLSNRQVIIITPLALPNIDPSPSVFIVKLDPPRKNRGGGGGQQRRIDEFVSTTTQ